MLDFGKKLSRNRWLAAVRDYWKNRFFRASQKPGRTSTAASQTLLCRFALVAFFALVLLHSWSPQPLTAQSAASQRATQSNHQTSPKFSRGLTQSRFEPQPRQFDAATTIQDDLNEPPAVRPNRVARAGLREVQSTDDDLPPRTRSAQSSQVPNFDIQQLVHVDHLVSPQGLKSSLGMGLVVTVLSLAPAILMMSTCFVRFIVVLSLLRQALGTPNLPPNQVLMGLSLCLTFLVMAPVWNESYQAGIRPYTEAKSESARPSLPEVFDKMVGPLRRFMSQQIEKSNNADAIWMFVEYQRPVQGSHEAETWREPETYDDVSLTVLLPAYLLSELKTAFLIGFQIYLPFLIIDLVVASVLMSMGMLMLTPTQVSLPFKLLLFVLIDGWTLTVGMLIESVRVAT
jgi:flagellar biosynthetic protein FliP